MDSGGGGSTVDPRAASDERLLSAGPRRAVPRVTETDSSHAGQAHS